MPLGFPEPQTPPVPAQPVCGYVRVSPSEIVSLSLQHHLAPGLARVRGVNERDCVLVAWLPALSSSAGGPSAPVVLRHGCKPEEAEGVTLPPAPCGPY